MGKLVITELEQKLCSVYFSEEGKPLELSLEPAEERKRLGNIYVGFVQQIVKNIDAAFIEIGEGEICYCSLKERVPYVFGAHANNERLCIGDSVIVQLEKEAIKTKQASVTAKLQLTGKYLVLVHGMSGVRISGKIKDKKEVARLQTLLAPFAGGDFGFIVRTNACMETEQQLTREAERLAGQYAELVSTGIHKARGSLLYQAMPGYAELLRDLPQAELTEVVTDRPEVFEILSSYCRSYQPEDFQKLRFYTDSMVSLSMLYSLPKHLREASARYVLLKSGASLVIEPTEALTVIDVNTGKAISKKAAGDEVFYRINVEAAQVCMEQIRLRNLSGMILIDFINMKAEEYNDRLMQQLRELAKKDRIPVEVVDMTGLGLVELTRKKVKKPLHECI